MSRSVQARFIALTVPLMAVLFAVSLGIYEYLDYKRACDDLLKRIDRFIASRSIILAEPVANGSEAQVGLILASIIADPDIVSVAIRDRTGKVIDSFGDLQAQDLIHRATSSITFADETGVRLVGHLDIAVGNARILRELRDRIGFEILIGLVLIGIATAVTMFGYRRAVARPLDRLGAAFASAQSGRDRRIEEWHTEDEMGELIRAYNDMQARLQEGEGALQAMHRELEGRVEERTRELEIARKAAEAASRAKTEFLSSMSHELRTPMNSILGFAQLLADDSLKPLDQRHMRSVRQILKSGEHLLGLIGEVLDLARIETGQINLSIQNVKPRAVIDECLAIVEEMANSRKIAIDDRSTDIADGSVKADQTRLRQVFLNLFSNAIKYNREGGNVTLEAEAADDGLTYFRIADTGPGIPSEKRSQIFEPFDRLGAEASGIEGAGIGLTLSKKLIESMGGRIGFDSIDSGGSVFWFGLPSGSYETREENDNADPALPPVAGSREIEGMVLYVEDNPTNIDLMELVLSRFKGVRLESAHTAEIGLVIAEAKLPDLILMDINLPGMDGVVALKALRGNPKTAHIPVVAVSGAAMPADIEAGVSAGFDAYVTKPFKIRDILGYVWRYLPQARRESAAASEKN